MQEKIRNILANNGIIVLDTNVYLNIYDRSPEYSEFSIRVLNSVKEHILMPSTVRREYFKHYKECFNRQKKKVQKSCDKLFSQLDQASQKIKNQCATIKTFQFPNIDNLESSLLEKINEARNVLDEYLSEQEIPELLNALLTEDDDIYNFVKWLVSNSKVLPDFSTDDIYNLAKIADQRYAAYNPPGFKDTKVGEGLSKYGDFFIWQQTIDFAAENNLPVVFVTDDVKSDWFQTNSGIKTFHEKLVEEFAEKVGTDFVGLTSIEFFDIISEINSIEKSTAVFCAAQYTADEYIDRLINIPIFDEILDELSWSGDKYVDLDTLSASASEGIELSDVVTSASFQNYIVYDYSDSEIVYHLMYKITLDATTHEYWGRDEDTRENIMSPGRIHRLEGELVLEVIREINEATFVDDEEYSSVKIFAGNLQEVSAYDTTELCVQCKNNIGIYSNYYGDPICASCMKIDEHGEICTFCGNKVPSFHMATDNCCDKCYELYDI